MNQQPQKVPCRSSSIQEPTNRFEISNRDSKDSSTSIPIISLSKLKNYMPKCTDTIRSLTNITDARRPTSSSDKSSLSETKDCIAHRGNLGQQSQQIQSQTHRKKSTQARDSRSWQTTTHIEKLSNLHSRTSDHQEERALNQVSAAQAAQQESKYLHRQNFAGHVASVAPVAYSDRSICIAPPNKGAKEAELALGTHSSSRHRPQLDQTFFLTDRDERKRKRTDNLPTAADNNCSSIGGSGGNSGGDGGGGGNSSVSSQNNNNSNNRTQTCELARGRRVGCGYVGNNMTPSALLQAQSLECAERLLFKQQSQDQLLLQRHSNLPEKDNLGRRPIQIDSSTRVPKISARESNESLEAAGDARTCVNATDERDETASHHTQHRNSNSSDAIEVVTLDQLPATATLISSHQSLSQATNQGATITSNDDANSNSIRLDCSTSQLKSNISSTNHLVKEHQQVACSNTAARRNIEQDEIQLHNTNFASNRAIQLDRLHNNYNTDVPLTNQYYQSNIQTSMLAGQQYNSHSYIGRRGGNLESANDSASHFDRQTVQQFNDTNVNSFNTARDLAQYQARSNNLNHYYNNQYNNFMPSSKSSSSNSSNSTPSPKAHNMQALNVGHAPSNQLITSSLNHSTTSAMAAAESHLDSLNHHYMNGSAASLGLSHQQHHQLNQHYSYNMPATAHHLTIPGHEQSYSHAQQQQQQQHAQQHSQNNLTSQQSIYHQIANGNGGGHAYSACSNSIHYHNQLQSTGNQANNLMSDAHQNHLNTAAAACAAAAVVSQTLKTVANQHNPHQHSHYGGNVTNGFGHGAGLMNMTNQHQQFHSSLGQPHLSHNHSASLHSVSQHQVQNSSVVNSVSVVTRKYQCKMCPQVFMSKAEMKYHNQNHMREAKPYKCLQCPKAFANSSYLSQHMRIHQGLKPYTCDICSRKFTQLSHLQQHKRTHTGDKPYKCNYMNCTKQFSQLSNLQSHSRCHQLDKPYKCNSCYKCFHDEQSLLEHIPRHLESKHLKKNLCIFCGSSYQQERGLVKHFQQYHTDKTPTLVAAAIAAGTTGNTSLIASLISSTQSGVFVAPSNGGTSGTSGLSGNGGLGANSLTSHGSSNDNATSSTIMSSMSGFQTNKCEGM